MTETVGTGASAAGSDLRCDALAGFLDQIDVASGSIVRVGEREFRLEPWLHAALGGSPGADDDALVRELIAEGLAFQAKCDHQLGRMACGELPSPGELQTLLDELVTDVAVGLALQRDVQRQIDRRVASGELARARHLTDFRNEIVHGVAGLKDLIGRDSIARAEELAPDMISRGPHATPVRTPLREEDVDENPVQFRRDVSYRPVQHVVRRSRSHQPRLKPMVLILVLLIGCYGVVQVVTHSARKGPPVLDASAFAQVKIVKKVVARPPSLFMQVDSAGWSSLPARDRLAILDELAAIAAVADYQGIHVTGTDGVAVGQWLRKRGTRLLEPTPEPPENP